MPLVFVQRYAPANVVSGVATQYITGTLQFTNPTVIELDPALFTQTGTYVLFDYTGATFAGGLSNVTVDATGTGFTASGLTDDSANSRITVTLS